MKNIKVAKLAFLCLAGVVLLMGCYADGFAGEDRQTKIVLTKDLASADHQEVFSAYETVYAVVTLSNLEPGQYTGSVNWIDPTGKVNQHTSVSFTIKSQSTYTFYSWLHLMKNGPLKRTLSGRDFDDEYLGYWQLQTFINETMLDQKSFKIH